ncbi:hypothetical protein Lepto7375DRAFT_0369 [Leptolyngbya sp. PCC 7375]|nr:hypothetical protein Lepto7375DRAFT_0369 [Leptolyngbya sp. PCC 7375]
MIGYRFWQRGLLIFGDIILYGDFLDLVLSGELYFHYQSRVDG